MHQSSEETSQPQVEIVRLPVPDWPTYKTLRLRALREDPQAYGGSYEKALDYPDEVWQNRLATGDWMFFAKVSGQVVGMMAAYQNDVDQETYD